MQRSHFKPQKQRRQQCLAVFDAFVLAFFGACFTKPSAGLYTTDLFVSTACGFFAATATALGGTTLAFSFRAALAFSF
jgi:hypothetical protein